MRKRLTMMLVLCLATALSAMAQAPEGYQYVDSLVYTPSAAYDASLVGTSVFDYATDGSRASLRQSDAVRQGMLRHISRNSDKKLSGYRVRIYFDNKQNSRGASEAALRLFQSRFPGHRAYRSFANPFFKVTAGDFRTRSEAMELLEQLRPVFPSAFVVRENISYPALDRYNSYIVDTVRVLVPVTPELEPMLKQGLELKQTQKLSPLQIQTIKLIETPFIELEQSVRNEFDNNPVLDDEASAEDDTPEENDKPKDVSIDEIKDDNIPSYRLQVNNWGKDERPQYNTFSVKESFTQSLQEQLGFKDLPQHERAVAEFIIGSLDEDGYLRRDIESLVDDLAFRAGIETDADEVLRMLRIIQEFDPVGVGARDLRECLLLQLRAKRRTPEVELAIRILEDYYNEFVNKHFQKILARLKITPEELRAAMAKIVKLNPSPGGQVDDSYNDQAKQIVPDFQVSLSDDGRLVMEMPRFPMPEIKIKRGYAEILEQARTTKDKSVKEAASFVKQKVDSAKWYLEALRQRHNTLESTMNAILDYQQEYFKDGDETKLKPMVLKDIAEITGYDISTISRVVSSKYVETHFGIFPLKYFFSEGLENKDGDEVSTRELKKALQELVDGEDKSAPLTDDQLVARMTSKGYKVARRTIAKYRDQLGIPMARLRKEL